MKDDSESPQPRQRQKRHRSRLSCTNCTIRRQKCDRAHPCGLCIERGVQESCEYSDVPYARPPPGRSAGSAGPAESSQTQTLRARVTELEQEKATMGAQLADLQQQLARAHAAHPSPRWSSSSDTPAAASNFASPSFVVGASAIDDPLGKRREDVHPRGNMVPLDETVYSRSYVYAQRSLGHVGEFIGRGSILCALHSVSSKSTARMLYACSTQSVECPIEYPGLGILLDHLPPRDGLDSLLDYYFANVNWRFGIPEKWFRDGYVDMANEKVAGSRINPNWLALLFAVLACVPSSASYLPSFHNYVHEPRKYHAHAKEACRMASAGYLDLVPLDQSLMASAADGAVLRCFAMTLLCTYLAENGYVSEAWKLTGSAIRLAESVGMHRDPSWALWQAMSVDESTLRRRS